MKPKLYGRSSSVFTRIARVFAAELGVDYDFVVLSDLTDLDPSRYGGNPALKIPVLELDAESYFGTIGICRKLVRAFAPNRRVFWPERAESSLLVNAQELVLHGLTSEVNLIMAGATGSDAAKAPAKLRASLTNVLAWLDANLTPALAELPPERELSYFEVSLFCFVTHLPFRGVASTAEYPALSAFAERFAERTSARATAYRFDA